MSSRCSISGCHRARLLKAGLGELEVQRAVVVQNQQALGPVRLHLVLHAVLNARPPRRDDRELTLRVARVQQPDLGRQLARRGDHQVALASGQVDADPELAVVLLVDDHVLAGRRAEQMAPDPVGPPGVIDGHVEQRAAVGGPGGAVESAGNLVGLQLAGPQVLDPQCEPLVPGHVGGVSQLGPVRADVEGADREEVTISGQFVPVEQDHLARQRRPVLADRRARVLRAGGAPAPDRVLHALDCADVVPPATLADGHGEIGLLGPGLDLGKDLVAQLVLALRQLDGEGVLRLQERDRLGIVLDGQPLVVVGERVAVVGPLCWHAFGGRGLASHSQEPTDGRRQHSPGPRTMSGWWLSDLVR